MAVDGKQDPNYRRAFTLNGHEKSVASLKYSPDGNLLASAGADCKIRMWDPHDGSHKFTLTQHTHGINDIAWSPDKRYLASVSDDKSVILWDVEYQKPLSRLDGHRHYAFCLNFSPHGNKIVSGDYEGHLIVWDVKNGRPCKEMKTAHREPVTACSFNPMEDEVDHHIVSGSYDGNCRVWNKEYRMVKTLHDKDSKPPISHVKFSPNGRFVVGASLDSAIRLWNMNDGWNQVRTYKSPDFKLSKYCAHVTFSVTHGRFVVSGSEDTGVHFFSVQEEGKSWRFAGHTAAVLAVDCHPTRNEIASGAMGNNPEIIVWKQQPPPS